MLDLRKSAFNGVNMKVWVLVPAYNEGHALGYLLQQLKSRGLSVLVVDDGSVDNTFEIAKDYADLALRNEKNCGKGMSLKKGVSYLLEHEEFDYVIMMDADGQHSPSDLDEFLRAANEGAVFVVGNRMCNPYGMPKIRVITNKFMSWLISKIAGQNIPDTQCGFRLISKVVFERIKMETNKFETESEFLVKTARYGLPIKSIPIKSIYFKNQKSKINPFIDTFRFIRFLAKIDKR